MANVSRILRSALRRLSTAADSGLQPTQRLDGVSPDSARWLMEELGVDASQMTGALSDLAVVKSRLQFYRQLGVSAVEFGELATQAPHVLAAEHGNVARENLAYLLSQGLTSLMLCNVVAKSPVTLSLSLEAHLKPRLAFYREELLLGENEMLKIFEECPEFLQHSIIKDIRWRVRYLLGMKLSQEDLIKLVILQCPQVLGSTFWDEIKPRMDYLRGVLGSHSLGVVLSDFPHVMLLPIEENLKPFVDYFLKELDMGRRLFVQMLENHPKMLSANVDRDIRPKIQFLKDLDLDRLQLFKIIVHRPQILTKSLKEGVAKRIGEMKEMGVPLELVKSLLIRSPRFFV